MELELIVAIRNMMILGCTAYVVFWKGHSPWWFLLAIILLERVEKN